MKDKKTTYVAIAAAAGVLISAFLVAIGKATLLEASGYLGAYGAFLLVILGALAKDSKKSVPTKLPEEDEGEVKTIDKVEITLSNGVQRVVIPGRGIKEPPPESDEE